MHLQFMMYIPLVQCSPTQRSKTDLSIRSSFRQGTDMRSTIPNEITMVLNNQIKISRKHSSLTAVDDIYFKIV
eukprot:m.1480107 g.1480107  ORF g.1480107 m.1480107 type:complete len:73 (+) comp25171_c2_seq24:1336-1554(+)